MNYVESFNLFGLEAMQIPCILGKGEPETSTVGGVGCLYMDTSSETKDLYKCISSSEGSYIWVDLFGHISDALDNIIASQNEFIGGDDI